MYCDRVKPDRKYYPNGRASLMNLIEAIIAVPDHRHPRGIRHPLWLILTIILLGSCTGYWGYKPLVDFTKNHRATLIKLFNLPKDLGLIVKQHSVIGFELKLTPMGIAVSELSSYIFKSCLSFRCTFLTNFGS